ASRAWAAYANPVFASTASRSGTAAASAPGPVPVECGWPTPATGAHSTHGSAGAFGVVAMVAPSGASMRTADARLVATIDSATRTWLPPAVAADCAAAVRRSHVAIRVVWAALAATSR